MLGSLFYYFINNNQPHMRSTQATDGRGWALFPRSRPSRAIAEVGQFRGPLHGAPTEPYVGVG